ncbi:MAG: MBL fold metallo-hydrolase [Promethearchaeota archaeon]
MIQVEIDILCNNCVFPFQTNLGLNFIEFNKLFATRSLAEHGLGYLITIREFDENSTNNNNEKKEEKSYNKKIIFDTGGPNLTFIHNFNIRSYQYHEIDAIALSHWHYDHTGSIYELLKQINKEIPIYCHEHSLYERFFKRASDIKNRDLEGKTREELFPLLSSSKIVNQEPLDIEKMNGLKGKVIFTKKPLNITEHKGVKIVLLGEIKRTHDEEKFSNFFSLQDGIMKKDMILDDRSLIIEFSDKVILLLGCCHSGIMNTLDQVNQITSKPITHIIGGFHMASATEERMNKTIDYLQSVQTPDNRLYLFPIHCSGANILKKLNELTSSRRIRAFNLSVGTKFIFR